MKKIITKIQVLIFSIGLIVTVLFNFVLQISMDMQEFRESSKENFRQIEQIVEENEQEIERIKQEFAAECVLHARAAAYIVQQDPTVIEDQEECKLVASLLGVDELHIFNREGVIYAGTHPEYYGYSFESGEQMNFFAPMLEDESLELCQDITPNTAEKKLMQYAAVWTSDKQVIVQVGVEPQRVLKEIEGRDISDIFAMISTDETDTFYAIDAQSGEILGATDDTKEGESAEKIGLDTEGITEEMSWGTWKVDGEKQYYTAKKAGELLLVKTCSALAVHRDLPGNMLLLCIYMAGLFLMLMLASNILLEHKIIRSILNMNKKLKEIEQGKWDTVLSEKSTVEFAELSRHINSMVGSLLDFSEKISKALELSQVMIGICEYVPDAERFTVTSRVKNILMLTDEELLGFMNNPKMFEEMKRKLCRPENCLEGNIYRLERDDTRYVRVESFLYKDSKLTLLVDMSANVAEKQSITRERDTDLLTGLYNRRAFYRRMETLFENPQQIKNGVMMMFDLDNLKLVNDLYGHSAGDLYLQSFALLLGEVEEKEQIAARMGGDEFILFVYGIEDEDRQRLKQIADSFLSGRGIQKMVFENGEEVRLEFSMGYEYCTGDNTDYQLLIKLADERMYKEKKIRKRDLTD